MKKKRVLICGAGSVGIFLGAKIYAKNHDICLFGRKKLKEAENEKQEIFINNHRFTMPLQLYQLPKDTKYDYIFLTSKMYDLKKIVKLLKKNNITSKIIAGVQNGIADVSAYEKILNKKILPICIFGGFKIDKNKLKSLPTPVGWLTDSSKEGKIISRFILSCGIKCHSKKKFDSFRAEKMIANCSLNALSAIEKKTFKQLFSEKNNFERIERLFEECHNLLKPQYPIDKKEKMKKDFITNWKNVDHYSSTYQDLVSHRKSEIYFFNGLMVKLGKKYKLSAIENKRILEDFKKAK